jgi:hypothetical protein
MVTLMITSSPNNGLNLLLHMTPTTDALTMLFQSCLYHSFGEDWIEIGLGGLGEHPQPRTNCAAVIIAAIVPDTAIGETDPARCDVAAEAMVLTRNAQFRNRDGKPVANKNTVVRTFANPEIERITANHHPGVGSSPVNEEITSALTEFKSTETPGHRLRRRELNPWLPIRSR